MAGIEMVGRRFGRLVVIERHHSTPKKVFWTCKCDCGNTTVVDGWSLRSGEIQSCGCLRIERARAATLKDIIGQKFGKLTVLEYDHTDARRNLYYKCQCECGNTIVTRGSALRSGHTQSCGCTTKSKTHNMHNSRLYHIHQGMLKRCYDPNQDAYVNYGGRGITVCDEWRNVGMTQTEIHKAGNPGFVNFMKWAIENGYNDNLTIDRKDVNGPYAPWNCRWITNAEQQLNKRTNQHINDSNEILVRSEFCKKYGLIPAFVSNRLADGWSLDAIAYAAKHPELGLHKPRSSQKDRYPDTAYLDKDQFQRLIPRIKDQVEP